MATADTARQGATGTLYSLHVTEFRWWYVMMLGAYKVCRFKKVLYLKTYNNEI